jgi:hypothetical protein
MKNTLLLFASLILLSCSNNEEENNTPNVSIPVLTTNAISNINLVSASSGGNIISDGGSSITARGVIWSTSQNPTITLLTKTSDGTGIGNFISQIINLAPNTTYCVRAYATNSIGTAYGNEVSFITGAIQLPIVSTTSISNTTPSTASSGGNISSDGGGTITARGVVWSTTQNPTIALNTKTIDGSGVGSYTSNISGLSASSTYYVRSYATNIAGTAYGNQINFTTQSINASMYPAGTIFCNNLVTAVIDITSPLSGKIWMDRNLGASQVATAIDDVASFGDLYQWGRAADGHQCRNSSTTTVLSSTDQPAYGNSSPHGSFILAPNTPYDWRGQQNSNLWQGINGVNNPCPNGYRLPTASELQIDNPSYVTAPTSFLKLPKAGRRNRIDGLIQPGGGNYWLSSFWSNTHSGYFYENNQVGTADTHRAYGQSVRCIKN